MKKSKKKIYFIQLYLTNRNVFNKQNKFEIINPLSKKEVKSFLKKNKYFKNVILSTYCIITGNIGKKTKFFSLVYPVFAKFIK